MSPFAVTINPSALDSTVTVFHLQGYLDAQTVRQLEGHYEAELARSRYRWVMEISQLEYISSAGLGAFVGVLSELRTQGGDIFFIGPNPKIAKIFQILGITRIFKIFQSEAEALKAFQH